MYEIAFLWKVITPPNLGFILCHRYSLEWKNWNRGLQKPIRNCANQTVSAMFIIVNEQYNTFISLIDSLPQIRFELSILWVNCPGVQ